MVVDCQKFRCTRDGDLVSVPAESVLSQTWPLSRMQAWDPSNAIALMEYTAKLGFAVGGFEVGNEKEHVLTPADYAGCMKTMSVFFTSK